jgi:hypothetical protein
MSSDADKYWDDIAAKLRSLKGLCPLTPEEAEAEFDAAPEIPLSDEQIRSIVDSVVSDELPSCEPEPELDWSPEREHEAVGEAVGEMYRNRGEDDPNTEKTEEELRQELLSDDESEEKQP